MGRKKKRITTNNITVFFSDERVKIVIGLFTLIFAAVLTLAFVSYLFTWRIDQSFEFEKLFSSKEIEVENWSGKFGAFFAILFMDKWFGLPSLVVPFLLVIIGFRLFRIKLMPIRKTTRISLIGMILFSITLGYIFSGSLKFLGSGPGGNHGYLISEWLTAFLGKTGAGFLVFALVFSYLIFSSKKIYALVKTNLQKAFLKKSDKNDEEQGEVPVDNTFTFETEEIKNKNVKKEKPVPKKESEKPTEQGDDEIINNNEDKDNLIIEEQKKEDVFEVVDKPGLENYDPTLDLSNYKFPALDLLTEYENPDGKVTEEEVKKNNEKIKQTLGNYGISIDKTKATVGPTVTLYEIVPAKGVKISKIKNLENDIALSLSALGIRIIAPIPGKGTIGIEVPNEKTEIVSIKSVLSSRAFQESKYELPVAMGKTIQNETFVFELTKMPHLLVAGATGQGKSVGLNVILTSLLFKKHPAQLKFVLVDPKMVELTLYNKIENHYLAKLPDSEEAIITDTDKVIHTLISLTTEMENRYQLLKQAYVRNIKEYNEKFLSRKLNPEKGHQYLPYIVLVVDEFADLIMTAGKEIEMPIARLAQKARAIGIHLIIATQRPSANIITGVIKANFPARIAFRVSSMIDSRTILDSPGANQLIGRGDMLISLGAEPTRLQCAFVDIPELEKVTGHINSQQGYPTAFELPEYVDENEQGLSDADIGKLDEMFEEAAQLMVGNQQGSTSMIQRKFSIGYNRAGRIMDQLEAHGIVGPPEGSKPRKVLFHDLYALEQFLNDIKDKGVL